MISLCFHFPISGTSIYSRNEIPPSIISGFRLIAILLSFPFRIQYSCVNGRLAIRASLLFSLCYSSFLLGDKAPCLENSQFRCMLLKPKLNSVQAYFGHDFEWIPSSRDQNVRDISDMFAHFKPKLNLAYWNQVRLGSVGLKLFLTSSMSTVL